MYAPGVSRELDAVILRGLSARPEERFATAAEMALALEKTAPILSARELGAWVSDLASDSLAKMATRVEEIERSSPSMVSVTMPLSGVENPETATHLMQRSGKHATSSPSRGGVAWSPRLTWALGAVSLLGLGALFAWHFGARAPTAPIDANAAITSASATSLDTAAPPSIEDASPPAATASAPAASASAVRPEPGDRAAGASSSSRSVATTAPVRKPPLEHRPLYKRE